METTEAGSSILFFANLNPMCLGCFRLGYRTPLESPPCLDEVDAVSHTPSPTPTLGCFLR